MVGISVTEVLINSGHFTDSMTSASALTENAAETQQPFILPTGDSADRIPPDKLKRITAADAEAINESMKAYVPSEETLIINNAESYYYYEQLNPTAKQIYDVMLMIAKDPAVEENYGVMMTDMDPNSDEYYYEMLSAYFAMTYDHPELFWLYNASET